MISILPASSEIQQPSPGEPANNGPVAKSGAKAYKPKELTWIEEPLCASLPHQK